jgi:hypothetical protein
MFEGGGQQISGAGGVIPDRIEKGVPDPSHRGSAPPRRRRARSPRHSREPLENLFDPHLSIAID